MLSSDEYNILASPGGRTAESAEVLGDDGPDRDCPVTDGVESGWPGQQRNRSYQKLGEKECCPKQDRKMGQFRQCWYGSQTDWALRMKIVSTTSEQAIWAYNAHH